MADLIESAIEVKKSLKELATISGSEDIEFPVDIEIGLEDLDLPEINSRTPLQVLRMSAEN